jgi:hypothetical protein
MGFAGKPALGLARHPLAELREHFIGPVVDQRFARDRPHWHGSTLRELVDGLNKGLHNIRTEGKTVAVEAMAARRVSRMDFWTVGYLENAAKPYPFVADALLRVLVALPQLRETLKVRGREGGAVVGDEQGTMDRVGLLENDVDSVLTGGDSPGECIVGVLHQFDQEASVILMLNLLRQAVQLR